MTTPAKKGKRITKKLKKPNPLFEKWLEEWKNDAAAKGSDMQFCFGKALSSLKKYPLPLNSGRECGILQNFGNRLCVMLDRKLAEYKKQNFSSESNQSHPHTSHCNSLVNVYKDSSACSKSDGMIVIDDKKEGSKDKRKNVRENIQKSPSSKKRRKSNEYIPAYRSGPYAILLGLLSCGQEEGYPGYAVKGDLVKVAQSLCDSSFTIPEHGSFYTAWSSMSTLVKKGYVSTAGRGKYVLTASGESLALKLQTISSGEADIPSTKDLDSEVNCAVAITSISDKVIVDRVPSEQVERITNIATSPIKLLPGSFEVVLLIDTREISGVTDKTGSNFSLLNNLNIHNITSEIRHLKIGDFTWICRDKIAGHEVVLPFIVERKRVDDYSKSIIDGRFHEQKYRLKTCGIPNLIYLVEKHGKESHTILPVSSLNQASVNTEVIDGFMVKYTSNHKETALYLAYFTQFLKNLFMHKTLVMCNKNDLPEFSVNNEVVFLMSFEEFNSSSKKNKKLCVRDMFIKQLVQLYGLSLAKALAITDRYPTPRHICDALKNERDVKFLANIPYGHANKCIGPVLSKSLVELYSNTVL